MTDPPESGAANPGGSPRLTPAQEKAAIVADLAAVGFPKVQDLTVFASSHKPKELVAAVPVLVDWLARARVPNVVEALAHALAGPHGQPAFPELLRRFSAADREPVQEAIGYAIAGAAGKAVGDQLPAVLALLNDDRTRDRSRQPLVEAIGAFGTAEALTAAERCLDDPDLLLSALLGIKRGGGRLSDRRLDVVLQQEPGNAQIARVVKVLRGRNGT